MKLTYISLLLLTGASLSVCAQNTVTYTGKLSAGTLAAMQRERKAGTEGYMQAFVQLDSDGSREALAHEYGIRFNAGAGRLYTALIPTGAVYAAAHDPRIASIDAGGSATPAMDRVRQLTGVEQIAADIKPGTLYDGTGVIVGVIDNGFDFTHPAFRDADGNCRISCAWDQNAMGEQTVYGYGTLYDTPDKVLGARHDNSYDTHGTHVLGIAAGSAGVYKGIATGADIAVVSTNKTEQGIIDGVDFLVNYAREQHKPIAINISYGSVLGYKDGTGSFALMLDRLLADRQGVVLNIATGNEGNRKSAIASADGCRTALQPPSYGRENIFVQGEPSHSYTLTLALKNTLTGDILLEKTLTSEQQTSEKTTGFGTDDRDNALLTMSSQANTETGAPSFGINLSYLTAKDEQWQIEIGTDGGRYLACCDYGSFADGGNEGFAEGSAEYTLAATSTGREPIAVGAYVSRAAYTDLANGSHDNGWTEGDIYFRSGQGPTFDGRTKPDVAAPGASVVSALNSYAAAYAAPAADRVYSQTAYGRTYYWGVGNGTSMATPVATGIMALWLQADPALTCESARQAVAATAASDTHTHDLPNNAFGYGKIDALAGLRYVMSHTGVGATMPAPPAYDIQNGTLVLGERQRICVYAADGTRRIDTTAQIVDLSTLASGMYILKFGCYSVKFCQK